MPAWDHTGTPHGFVGLIHLHSSTMSGSTSWMRRRTSARVSARQPPRDRIRSSMRREAAFSFARFASAPGLAFAPAFGGDLDLVADLRGLLALFMIRLHSIYRRYSVAGSPPSGRQAARRRGKNSRSARAVTLFLRNFARRERPQFSNSGANGGCTGG